MTGAPLLQVRGLRKEFQLARGWLRRRAERLTAVDGISFDVRVRETLALVGESGCGKTTAARTLLRLVEPTAGEAWFHPAGGGGPVDLFSLTQRELRPFRRELQLVFQDPFASLNPRMSVGNALAEVLKVHRLCSRSELSDRVAALLEQVGLPPEAAARFPHEFSGGQRQRIGIARALAVEPRLIVCDEAVSALDVSIQAQIINLLADLQEDLGLSTLVIAHDLAVVRHLAQRVAVMYLGQIVEVAETEELFEGARHPYTRALLSAMPLPVPGRTRERIVLQGEVPSPLDPPTGCRFHRRCPLAEPRCSRETPAEIDLGGGHRVACLLVDGAE